MSKYIIYFFIGLIIIGAGFYIYQNQTSSNNITTQNNLNQTATMEQKNDDILPTTEQMTLAPTSDSTTDNTTDDQNTVPLPTEEDIIRTFFSLIDEKRAGEAVMMMSSKNINDDSSKQAWGGQFNAIKSISVLSIDPWMQDSWSTDRHSYKTTLESYVSSEAANAPIPYYGWHDNPNIRWVTIVKENDLWKIDEIATGP